MAGPLLLPDLASGSRVSAGGGGVAVVTGGAADFGGFIGRVVDFLPS